MQTYHTLEYERLTEGEPGEPGGGKP